MHYTQDPLWQKIEAYTPDNEHTAYPFSSKLAHEQNWTGTFTTRAIEEYKKFIYLCCIMPQGASPPHIVDEVWHLHLTYTKDYWQRFCRQTLGRDIHHTPSAGRTDKEKYEQLYIQTLLFYSKTFGNAPPQDIWPIATQQPPDAYPISKHHFFETGPPKRFLLLLIPFLLILILFQQPIPFLLDGPQFLLFYLLLIVCTVFVTSISLKAMRQQLSAILSEHIDNINKYELAYLAGGKNRLLQVCLSDLINNGQLIFNGTPDYAVNSGNELTGNPLLPYLVYTADTQHTTLNTLARYIDPVKDSIHNKYHSLIKAVNNFTNHILPPLALAIIGIIRCIQGARNEQPIAILVLMIFISMCICMALSLKGVHAITSTILKEEPDYTRNIDDREHKELIAYGLEGMSIPILFYGLDAKYKNPTNGNGVGSGDGGGCSSGGGCGGGCGGCGGCGG